MRVDVAATARGVRPESALSWWTDFREGRTDHPSIPGARRRVARHADGTWTIHDEARVLGVPVWRERYRVRVEGLTVWLFDATSWYATYTASYTFGPHADGTSIRLEADIRLRGPLSWVSALAAWFVRWLLRADLRTHVDEMVAELVPPAR